MEQEIEKLKTAIARLTAHGLLSVGSGGSYTAASFQTFLHESITGKLSYACTPYQLLNKQKAIRNAGVSVLSAEGRNKDVLGCFQYLVAEEPLDIMVFTLKAESFLNELAEKSSYASSLSYSMPWGKDGYLATNSLIATCVILYRAYYACFEDVLPECPASVDNLLDTCIEIDASKKLGFLNSFGDSKNIAFLVVTGLSGQMAGIDLESRIAESAMGTCQVVDFRSFAHGRHLWASQNKTNAAAIVFWSEDERELYESFKNTVPTSLPVLSIKLKGPSYLRQLASIVSVVQLVKDFGDKYGIDPGQPEVPQSGRDIYELDAFTNHIKKNKVSERDWAVFRKFGYIDSYGMESQSEFLSSYDQFVGDLTIARFGAIVFDYDATLCTPDNRYCELEPLVAKSLNDILAKGVKVGIATGRGKSVPEKMFNAIDSKYHDDFIVGMYNGSLLKTLSEKLVSNKEVGPSFEKFMERINNEPILKSVFKTVETRPTQISFEAKDGTCSELAWRTICELLQEKEFWHLKALRSTHSWDVIERMTSKTIVSDRFIKNGLKVLSIGDRGLWPGNDCELLSYGLGLGVDEVSPIINKAWNIAPRGLRGVDATLYYLRHLKFTNGTFTFDMVSHHE